MHKSLIDELRSESFYSATCSLNSMALDHYSWDYDA